MTSVFNVKRRRFIGGVAGAMAYAASSAFVTDVQAVAYDQGYVQVPSGKVWWQRLGGGNGTPLIMLHGGPGAGHDYLLPLKALADERPVIFYDQLGCGLSDSPQDSSIYTVQRAVDELDAVRHALNLNDVVLFGHSWGSILAIEYLCQGRGQGVHKLALGGAIASVPQFVAGTHRLLAAMPNHEGARIAALYADGKGDTPEYQALVQHFYDLHLCRRKPTPPEVLKTFDTLGKSIAYKVMNGPNEFTVTGVIKDWDRRDDLARIKMPTFITTGQYDEVTRDCHETIQRAVTGAKLQVFADCSHLTMNEAPKTYARALRAFLA
jgi:proline iminopeptidase